MPACCCSATRIPLPPPYWSTWLVGLCQVGAHACLGDPVGRTGCCSRLGSRGERRDGRAGWIRIYPLLTGTPEVAILRLLAAIAEPGEGGYMHPGETGDGRSPGETGDSRSPSKTDDSGSRRVLWAVVITVAVLLVAAVVTAIAWPARWQTISSSVRDYRWWLILAAIVAAAIVVLLVFNKLLQRPWGAPWRVNILAAADALHYELDALPAGATPDEQALRRSVGKAVEHHLCKARKAGRAPALGRRAVPGLVDRRPLRSRLCQRPRGRDRPDPDPPRPSDQGADPRGTRPPADHGCDRPPPPGRRDAADLRFVSGPTPGRVP
jgi:hypothetical protein